MFQDLFSYLVTGLLVALLIPWACLETASFLSSFKPKPVASRTSHWVLAFAFLGIATLSGCAGSGKNGGPAIVAPKAPGGAGATKTVPEGDGTIAPSGGGVGGDLGAATGTTAGSDGGSSSGEGSGGGDTGSTTGATLGEPPVETGMSPALIMHVVKTILN